jgi:hypothetical protein
VLARAGYPLSHLAVLKLRGQVSVTAADVVDEYAPA